MGRKWTVGHATLKLIGVFSVGDISQIQIRMCVYIYVFVSVCREKQLPVQPVILIRVKYLNYSHVIKGTFSLHSRFGGDMR